MIRGTRIIMGEEARLFSDCCEKIRRFLISSNFSEIILPSLSEQEVFVNKAGPEILEQMYIFQDRKQRNICLIPEATALVQKIWNEQLSMSSKRPLRLFYIQRCYRYERPQAGRYREFTQAGIEILGGKQPDDKIEAIQVLKDCLAQFQIDTIFNPVVKRGLSYYIEDGFEVDVASLGAQKQIAGGGRYVEGIGWAIGVDRLLLALAPCQK
jgi:histidyl-tRNA synthetase